MNEISLNGWVFKYTNFIYGYQERYFKIENGSIFYYLSKENIKDGCRKYRQLSNFAIEVDENDDPCRLDIVFTDDRWCLRFKSIEEMIVFKNALRSFLPMPISPVPSRDSSIDMHKLAIMSKNMNAQYENISSFLDRFVGNSREPINLSIIEQTVDCSRQLESNLRHLRAMLRMCKVKETYLSDEEFFDCSDEHGDIQLDKQMTDEFKQDLTPVSKVMNNSSNVSEVHEHPLYSHIRNLTAEQIRYAKAGVDEGTWELFCQDGAMKMYKREMESDDGCMIDPLKSIHSVEGISAKEYITCFFKSEYKPEWDDTLIKLNVVETLDPNTIVLHQLHKKVWPAAQRESLFWSHLEEISDQKEDDAFDAWIVCNHNIDRDDVPLTNPSCVRVGLKIAMLCQTIINPDARSKSRDQITRNDISVRIFYVASVHPGGWLPSAALRQVYKKEYPRFLRRFSAYVVEKVQNRPLDL
uniref:START domain-containing protein n=1 Tax=Panagrolaimus sp. PS1159 TaxID=55785 RepID=A0AC35FY38_9BILA